MNIAKNVYGINKRAGGGLVDTAAVALGGLQSFGDLLSGAGVFLMGAAFLTGGAVGYTAAKLTAHGKQDV